MDFMLAHSDRAAFWFAAAVLGTGGATLFTILAIIAQDRLLDRRDRNRGDTP